MQRGHTTAGFTLLEMVVAVSLFAIVSVAMAGATVSVMDANRKSISLVEVVDGLTFALDSMTREIRVGSSFDCDAIAFGTDCASPADSFSFRTSINTLFVYRLNGGSIERCGSEIVDCPDVADDDEYQRLTGSNLVITRLDFYVFGTEPANDEEQPRVTIVISGIAGDDPDTSSSFTIQTTVTQRFPDV